MPAAVGLGLGGRSLGLDLDLQILPGAWIVTPGGRFDLCHRFVPALLLHASSHSEFQYGEALEPNLTTI